MSLPRKQPSLESSQNEVDEFSKTHGAAALFAEKLSQQTFYKVARARPRPPPVPETPEEPAEE